MVKKSLTDFLLFSFCLLYLPVRWWRQRTFDFAKVRRLLIVALNHGVGTTILLMPLLRSLKKNRPDLHVTVLSSPKAVGELLAGADYVDDIIIESGLLGARPGEGLRFFKKEIRPGKFDLAISTFYDTSDKISLWKFFSGAPFRLGYEPGIPGLLNTFTLSWNESTHEVNRHLDLLRFLGIQDLDEDLSLPVGYNDRLFAGKYLAARGVKEGDLVLGIHAGAKADWPEKRWPLERFIRVAREFSAKHGGKVIFFGGPDDREESALLAEAVGEQALANRQTLKETAALIGRCTLFLCNDSGLMHVASAMKVPVVAVFGPTRVTKNHPWGVPYELVRKELPCSPCYSYGRIICTEKHECMLGIGPEEVSDALDRMLRTIRGQGPTRLSVALDV
ncbi:MAG: glycosyltransferase family 9 protein [Chloroflexi bacterium]|nr:glycosyltransferase family 9 protein [Chloroflexota bacterium]